MNKLFNKISFIILGLAGVTILIFLTMLVYNSFYNYQAAKAEYLQNKETEEINLRHYTEQKKYMDEIKIMTQDIIKTPSEKGMEFAQTFGDAIKDDDINEQEMMQLRALHHDFIMEKHP